MTKISQFPPGGAAQGTDLIPIVRAGGDYTVAAAQVSGLNSFVSVITYGADNSGVADSATAFQAAANANLLVVIPPGTYKIGSSITCANRAVFFWGRSRGAVTINTVAGNYDLFSWTGSGATGGGIAGVTIVGTGQTGGNLLANGNAGNNTSQSRWTVRDVTLINGWNGIYVQDQNVATLTNVWINGTFGTGPTNYAIKCVGATANSSNVIDLDNVEIGFTGAPSANSPVGLWLDGSAATIDIRHLSVVNSGYGLYVTNSPNLTFGVQFISAYDLQVDTCYNHGIYMTGGTGSSTTHHFTDLYEHFSSQGAGMYIESSVTFVTVQAGIFITNGKQAVYANGRYCKFLNLQCSINSQLGVGTYPSVQFGANSIGNELIGSLSGTWSGFAGANTSYGLQLDAGAVLYTAVGCDFSGNTVGDINDLSSHFARSFSANRSNTIVPSPGYLEGGTTVGFRGVAVRTKQKGVQGMSAATTSTVTLPVALYSSAVTNISKAASAVVTTNDATWANNPFQKGSTLYFYGVVGMVEINGVTGNVTAIGGSAGAWTATTDINSTGFTAYVSGGTVMVNYQVALTASATGGPFWVTTKTAATFVINVTVAFTGNVDWIVEQ